MNRVSEYCKTASKTAAATWASSFLKDDTCCRTSLI